MMGKDCERIILSIASIINATSEAIGSISNLNVPPIKVKADHTHSDDGAGPASKTEFIEKESKVSMSGPLSKVTSLLSELSPDLGKLQVLEDGLYIETFQFHNSIGSPWTEVKGLKKAIDSVLSYTGEDYVGDRAMVTGLLNIVLARAVDAKWALILYHDNIQRGFDYHHNNKEPSIVHRKNYLEDELDVPYTMGVKNQDIDENVHITKESHDPW